MKGPPKVILLGEHWERLEAVLTAVSAGGRVEFVGPFLQGLPDTLCHINADAIMVPYGPGGSGLELLNVQEDAPTPRPAVLLCLDWGSLESDDLYESVDDFVLVPCSAAELEKRLGRLVRAGASDSSDHILSLGPISLHTNIYEVRLDGRRVNLAWMEFKLLKFLMEHSGRIFTRNELLSNVWSVDTLGGTRTVDMHIRRLRQKLGSVGSTCIRTVANVGYGLVEP